MKHKIVIIGFLLLIIQLSCKTNAITGRNQLKLVSDSELQNMAVSEYRQFLSKEKVLNNNLDKNAIMVKNIGIRISNAITKYYNERNLASELVGYNWEYNLVDSKQVNAWCMPGGKIVVYTGLLPITKNEDALAVVIGHEIAHALAKHGNERMSQSMLQQFGNLALSIAVNNKPKETQDAFLNAYGVGSSVGFILPHSRKQELEADKFGLRFAALAGYNIREAIPLWNRMKTASGNNGSTEFLNTHPAEDRRISELSKIMDETIRDYFKPNTN
jgi:predicted Zn-dependent protease